MIAVTSILVPGSIIVSILTTRLGRFRWAIWGGWAIVLLSCGLFSRLDKDTPTYEWALYFAIFGLGNGMCLTSVNFGIQAISHVEDAGAAASMYAFVRSLGMSIGVAVSFLLNLPSPLLSSLLCRHPTNACEFSDLRHHLPKRNGLQTPLLQPRHRHSS